MPQLIPRRDPDLALETARDLLDGVVCECGHCDDEHEHTGRCGAEVCPCPRFRPVAFTVTRA